MNSALLERLNHRIAKLQFGAKKRVRFYGHLTMMLENRIMLIDALREMHNVASEDGRKPDTSDAIILESCHEAVSEGSSLADGLRPWVNANEVAVIAAGEQSGDMRSAFQDAITMIEAGSKIRGAIAGAAIYPVVLLTMLCVLLHIVADSLVPKLSAVSDPETWDGAAYILYRLGTFVDHYGLYALAGALVSIIVIGISLPLLGGRLRIFLDRFPPWSLYRAIHGSIFMLNVSLLIRAGMMLQAALELLYERAGSHWLRQRIEATLENIAGGAGFGDALHDTGYNFPDREGISYLRLLSRLQGFDQSMAKFARHWLDETIAKVQGAARGFLLASILLMGGMLVLVVSAVSDIENAIQQSVSQPAG
ncbi:MULTISPECIES: type II secretion system F family protein [unclassified Herbaspirillum]|uniref:type II secretion system F family protein n=1 Tax=unclassified Herbaspirillum TaxID=2624150 RepID=UPI00114EA4C1|nr:MULTISPECIES: type II secretion system F family protein [unclassified Herbaspirillum]MBB5390534.1 type II secretory pathway component PulF [Herbaspirillum sp. SJZ102]TQK08976.1 type II secretory pathway component PulF [Herbaspirillum sp. SJZ130]TQK14337.1 type II secretory pathway component PulF [Herbaspirillum sp. SJZ106]TWC66646.1 type II secretory pathway component PulF [Herbaspirillum sp. SJZ099]